MGGRIAAFALGRRSTLGRHRRLGRARGRARAAAAEAADDRLRRERDVLHARGRLDAGRPPARHALPRGRRRDRGDRVRGRPRARSTSARRRSRADVEELCATADAAGAEGRRRARTASACGELGHVLGAGERRRRRSRATTPRDAWCCSRSSTAATTPSRSPRTSPRSARSLPGPDGDPLRSYVTGAGRASTPTAARRSRASTGRCSRSPARSCWC